MIKWQEISQYDNGLDWDRVSRRNCNSQRSPQPWAWAEPGRTEEHNPNKSDCTGRTKKDACCKNLKIYILISLSQMSVWLLFIDNLAVMFSWGAPGNAMAYAETAPDIWRESLPILSLDISHRLFVPGAPQICHHPKKPEPNLVTKTQL